MATLSPKNLYIAAHAVLGLTILVTQFIIVPVLAQMVLYTGTILYIASHHSLSMFEKNPETGEAPEVETVSGKDALLFPFIGSAALFSMYVAYKFFGKYWVNILVTTYLTCVGLVGLAETASPMLAALLPASMRKPVFQRQFHIPFMAKSDESLIKLSFSQARFLGYVVSAAASGFYLYSKHWLVHNLFAISFSLQAVSMISLGKFRIAFLLLTGLFFYDIFWVFGTEVMVKVATNFDGPIKIIFPVSFDPWKQSILGLGDIVIPGIFVAMSLRFDAYLHREKSGDAETHLHSAFPKVYFGTVFVAYLCGLLLTGVVMFAFNAAQPALLYLVPSTIFALLGASVVRGEFRKMWEYNEEDLAPKKDAETEKAKDK